MLPPGAQRAVVEVSTAKGMTLNFPNETRSFDASKNRVRFWGYDSAIEISFFVETEALEKFCPGMSDAEARVLKVFDDERAQIHAVADRVYGRGPKNSYTYTLAATDF